MLGTFESVTLKQLDSVELQNRIDTKYVLTQDQLLALLRGIRDEQFVLEIDERRLFNYKTVYYDTADFQFFKDHHNGKTNRFKVRIRKYVESEILFLEVKHNFKGRNKYNTCFNEF